MEVEETAIDAVERAEAARKVVEVESKAKMGGWSMLLSIGPGELPSSGSVSRAHLRPARTGPQVARGNTWQTQVTNGQREAKAREL